jgi:polysaccharide pyruvyl transferase WcaK-like protein
MKGKNPRITLLGNNSGRNLGDAAILSSIMEQLSCELPDAEFICPTIAPKWVKKHYGNKYNVNAVDVMPWTGSIRLLGIPTLYHLARSDAALICDGIIFGIRLFNPAFNYLITLIFLVPWARLFNCKVVCYNVGIGPFPSFFSKLFGKWVLNGSDLILMREKDSAELGKKIGCTKEMPLTGDSAFINPVSSDAVACEICRKEGIDLAKPILGVNITSYVDDWLGKDEKVDSRETFAEHLASGLRDAICQTEKAFQIVIFSTHPMDEKFCGRLAKCLDAVVIDNSRYLSHDIMAVMSKCSLFVGMRFHSLILASAVGVPIVGLSYAPKVRSYLRLMDCPDFCLELSEITPELLTNTLTRAWKERSIIADKQQRIVASLKDGAKRAGKLFLKLCYPERVHDIADQDNRS